MPSETIQLAADQLDFFVSSIAHAAALAVVSLAIAITRNSLAGYLLAAASLAVIPLAYRRAVANVKDWMMSVKAMVNLGRHPLSKALGLSMPDSIEVERHMWESYLGAVEYADPKWVDHYDSYRTKDVGTAIQDRTATEA